MDGRIKKEVTMMVNGQVVRPDFLVDFGDRGCVAINLKCVPGTNKNSPLVSELEVFDLINTFVNRASKKSTL